MQMSRSAAHHQSDQQIHSQPTLTMHNSWTAKKISELESAPIIPVTSKESVDSGASWSDLPNTIQSASWGRQTGSSSSHYSFPSPHVPHGPAGDDIKLAGTRYVLELRNLLDYYHKTT